jgi:hypothetical protein
MAGESYRYLPLSFAKSLCPLLKGSLPALRKFFGFGIAG